MQRRNFLAYLLLFLGGCSAARTASDRPSALAGPETIQFAVTDIQGLENLEENYGAFRDALAQATGKKIQFFPVESYTAAAIALRQGDVDLALTGPAEYVLIRARTNAQPVIAITRPNYHSVIVVPAGSGIQNVSDLRGKTLALSSIGSTSGHLGPTKLLMEAGLDPRRDLTLAMLGDEGVEALQAGRVDAWGGSAVDYQTFLAPEASQFSTIAQGPPLPSDVFVAASGLELAWVEALRDRMVAAQTPLIAALVRGEETQKYQGSQLVTADDTDYNMIRDVYEAIGQGNFVSQRISSQGGA
ncbi:phosphate/phosphite/phosphonate ABC transporter substrate-binding protein [Geitlerinema sp. PCC 7407]|uniref:phosphate/phosphite/phosphonate ABC transporter substrate-binding protein n=1 Tax=Geitlerinema sp. PCC 7407 TaxID=1173025 RepID=UPI00029FC97C|nr:phosphate/phosphite/phosphonate ABC transporter substrate-binding protein [Geitlerinema sp. PCC 7407]AFY65662.1 phosphonate ABC transporter, periplasmic phosphonate-binding protein [Geitlerinema sp. PCC 7407]